MNGYFRFRFSILAFLTGPTQEKDAEATAAISFLHGCGLVAKIYWKTSGDEVNFRSKLLYLNPAGFCSGPAEQRPMVWRAMLTPSRSDLMENSLQHIVNVILE